MEPNVVSLSGYLMALPVALLLSAFMRQSSVHTLVAHELRSAPRSRKASSLFSGRSESSVLRSITITLLARIRI